MSVVLLGGGGHASDVLAVIEALSAAGEPQGPVYVADDTWAQQPERFEDRAVEVKRVESIDAGISLGRHMSWPSAIRWVDGTCPSGPPWRVGGPPLPCSIPMLRSASTWRRRMGWW